MSEAQRKTYPASFKAKVGLEAIRGVKTASEIGQEHGVHPVQVGPWQKAILEQAGRYLRPSVDAGKWTSRLVPSGSPARSGG